MHDSEELSRRMFVKRVLGSVAAVGLGLTAAAAPPKPPKGLGSGVYTVYTFDRDARIVNIRYEYPPNGSDLFPSTSDRRQDV